MRPHRSLLAAPLVLAALPTAAPAKAADPGTVVGRLSLPTPIRAGGYLEWVYSFGGSGGGELIPGIFRARLSSGELTRADFPQAVDGNVVGFAPFAADGAYMTDARLEEDACGDDIDPATGARRQCRLVQSGPLVFGRRLRARI